MKNGIHHLDRVAAQENWFPVSLLEYRKLAIKHSLLIVLCCLLSATLAHADALTGFYTQVAFGDPDFGGGSNAGGTLTTGLVESQLGPNGLPVLSASGITRLGTSSDMNPTTHELLWWSAGADPYVSLDSNPVQTNSMPFNYGYPNPWYPTGQTSDQNFYRTVQWQGTFNMASAGSISLSLQVDDDAWVFIDGTLVAEDHYGYVSYTSTPMSAGTHSIKIFYDDRFPAFDAMLFSSSVPLSPAPSVPSFSAKDTYKALVAAIAISTNQDGNLTYHKFGNRELIRECAAEAGLTNLMGLYLVYDLKTDTIDVVHGTGTNEALVCTPLTFSGSIFLSNPDGAKSERMAWVYWGNDNAASGTLTATERYEYGVSNQLVGFSLRGQLQFALPGIGTNAPTIYRGSLIAGSKLTGPFGPFGLPAAFYDFSPADFGGHRN